MDDNLTYEVTLVEAGRIRVEVYFQVGDIVKELLGILYFERAKRSFNRKPVGMDQWLCVDAKVEGLYTRDKKITPPEIVARCYQEIKRVGY